MADLLEYLALVVGSTLIGSSIGLTLGGIPGRICLVMFAAGVLLAGPPIALWWRRRTSPLPPGSYGDGY